jgi:hypothetical protein
VIYPATCIAAQGRGAVDLMWPLRHTCCHVIIRAGIGPCMLVQFQCNSNVQCNQNVRAYTDCLRGVLLRPVLLGNTFWLVLQSCDCLLISTAC